MVFASELIQLAENRMNELRLVIEEAKTYLERLEPLRDRARTAYEAASSALEEAKRVIDNNSTKEKSCPSLKKNPRWQILVQAAADNLKEKEENYNLWKERFEEYTSDYLIYSDKLRAWENEYSKCRALIRRLPAYSANAENGMVESVPAYLNTRFTR